MAGLRYGMQVSARAAAPLSSGLASLHGRDSSNVAGWENALECGTGWSSSWEGGAKRSMHTDVAAARVGRRPAGASESQVSS